MPIFVGLMILIAVLVGGNIASQTKKPNILPTPTVTVIIPTENQPTVILSPPPTKTPTTIPKPTLTPIPTQIPSTIPKPTSIPPTSIPQESIYVPPTQVPQQAPQTNSGGFSCNCSKVCGAMASCEEAYFQLNTCGCSVRDGDHDGVPCETICSGG